MHLTPYHREQMESWWRGLAQLMLLRFTKEVFTLWLIDANLAMGSARSESVGAVHAEEESSGRSTISRAVA